MGAINRDAIKIYIAPVDTNATDLQATNLYKGTISSYSQSGGERAKEAVPLFGGYIDEEAPRDTVTLEFEIVPDISKVNEWHSLAYNVDSGNAGVYTMSGAPADKTVFIEAKRGSNYSTVAYNNVTVQVMEMEHDSTGNRTYNLNLSFIPQTSDGVSNIMIKDTALTTLPAWTALDGNN
jgi:hypothetical protein